MSVYLEKPKPFEAINMDMIGNDLIIETRVPDCKICVTSAFDHGDELFVAVDSVNSHTFTLGPGVYNICITKQGYIPYVATIGDNVYIQNQEIDNSSTIYGSRVYIGKDVTDEQPIGNVVITKGKTTILNKKGTYIKNAFKVKRGAALKIGQWE